LTDAAMARHRLRVLRFFNDFVAAGVVLKRLPVPKSKVSDEKREEILKALLAGKKVTEICRLCRTSGLTVSQIRQEAGIPKSDHRKRRRSPRG
jgi:hypothetical protein